MGCPHFNYPISKDNISYLATLINPKTRQPIMAIADENACYIGHPVDSIDDFEVLGSGYLIGNVGDCRGANTGRPGGILFEHRRTGLGVVLYCGLALLSETGCVGSLKYSHDVSYAAIDWWKAALRHNLAYEDGHTRKTSRYVISAKAVFDSNLVLHCLLSDKANNLADETFSNLNLKNVSSKNLIKYLQDLMVYRRYRRNSDEEIRRLEREYTSSGDPELLRKLSRVRNRISSRCWTCSALTREPIRFRKHEYCPDCYQDGVIENDGMPCDGYEGVDCIYTAYSGDAGYNWKKNDTGEDIMCEKCYKRMMDDIAHEIDVENEYSHYDDYDFDYQ